MCACSTYIYCLFILFNMYVYCIHFTFATDFISLFLWIVDVAHITWQKKTVNIKQHISLFLSTFNGGDIIFYSVQKKKQVKKYEKKSQKVSIA